VVPLCFSTLFRLRRNQKKMRKQNHLSLHERKKVEPGFFLTTGAFCNLKTQQQVD